MKIPFLVAIIGLANFTQFATAQQDLPADLARLANHEADFHQYEGQVVEVIDGDTLRVTMHLLPGLQYIAAIRIRGIDSPELRTSCSAEKLMAQDARDALSDQFQPGEWVLLENIGPDSFAGRLVANVKRQYAGNRWRWASRYMVEEGWAISWQPGDESFDWCGLATERYEVE